MKWILTAVLVLAQFPATAGAAHEYAVCDDCSEVQYREAAVAHMPADPDRPRYEVYVADIPNGNLRRFRVTVANEPGLYLKYAKELAPAETELANFAAFLAARAEILRALGVLDFTVEIPPGHFVGSAYDLWGSNRNQLLVREFINSELSILETAFSNLFAFGSFLLDRSASKLFIKVQFPDGSLAFFELQGKHEDLVWEYLQSKSTDQDGNIIPDRLSDFAGYSGLFNTLSVQDFLLRATLYGIPIVDQSDGGDHIAVVCVHAANGDYSCVTTSPH